MGMMAFNYVQGTSWGDKLEGRCGWSIEDLFVMMMITEIDGMNVKFTEFVDRMNKKGKEMGLEVHTMHEDIFNAMHKI